MASLNILKIPSNNKSDITQEQSSAAGFSDFHIFKQEV